MGYRLERGEPILRRRPRARTCRRSALKNSKGYGTGTAPVLSGYSKGYCTRTVRSLPTEWCGLQYTRTNVSRHASSVVALQSPHSANTRPCSKRHGTSAPCKKQTNNRAPHNKQTNIPPLQRTKRNNKQTNKRAPDNKQTNIPPLTEPNSYE